MKKFGKILWQDLTVDDATNIKDFYCDVVGWTFEPVNQGEYEDFNIINPDDGEVVAGICHRRGLLSNFPAQWLNYVMVENLDDCLDRCNQSGGKVFEGPSMMGKSRFAIIQDPAGAYLVLMEE